MKEIKQKYPNARVLKLRNRSVNYYQVQSEQNPVNCLFADGMTKEKAIENFKQKYLS